MAEESPETVDNLCRICFTEYAIGRPPRRGCPGEGQLLALAHARRLAFSFLPLCTIPFLHPLSSRIFPHLVLIQAHYYCLRDPQKLICQSRRSGPRGSPKPLVPLYAPCGPLGAPKASVLLRRFPTLSLRPQWGYMRSDSIERLLVDIDGSFLL